MTAATVLIPTHNHVETLRHAVASVRQQNLQDFELLIVGDGVSSATRAVVGELMAADSRIRFFDFPKAPRKGEINRHQALQYAQGRFVAYLGDDDYWMPNHLEVLDALLTEVDFGHTMQVAINSAGEIVVMAADLQNPSFRHRMLTELFNRFDLTFAGHTMAAYRRLPHGWRTTPSEFPWTDLYMWRQFLAEPWCRARSAMVPTGINTWTHQRPHLNDRERADDLAHWAGQTATPAFHERLWRLIAQRFAEDSVGFELHAVGEAERCAIATQELALSMAECDALRTSVQTITTSASWRVTWPLRQLGVIASRFDGR